MAGTLVISKARQVSITSVSFDHLAEEIRQALDAPDELAFVDAFRAYDNEAVMTISLVDLHVRDFQTFTTAARAAMEVCIRRHGLAFRSQWIELITTLASDPRSRQSQ